MKLAHLFQRDESSFEGSSGVLECLANGHLVKMVLDVSEDVPMGNFVGSALDQRRKRDPFEVGVWDGLPASELLSERSGGSFNDHLRKKFIRSVFKIQKRLSGGKSASFEFLSFHQTSASSNSAGFISIFWKQRTTCLQMGNEAEAN